MKKTIWEDVKEILKWYKGMTTWHNVMVTIVAFGLFVVAALIVIGAVVWGVGGYNYVVSLYNAADEGGKLGLIGGVVGAFVGAILTIAAGAISKKVKDK